MQYIGTLSDGTEFDRSRRGPMSVWLGESKLIQGWTDGLAGIKEGGKRKLLDPAGAGLRGRGHAARYPTQCGTDLRGGGGQADSPQEIALRRQGPGPYDTATIPQENCP